MKKYRKLIFFICSFFLAIFEKSFAFDTSSKEFQNFLEAIENRCTMYGWKNIEIKSIPWQYFRKTQQNRPLMYAYYGNPDHESTLIIGAVHGDELTTVYVLFKMLNYIKENPSLYKDKSIIIAPLANPDGFFSKTPQRTNASGIDINRNFPTKDWNKDALLQWKEKTNKNKRYFPGKKSGTEQETLFQIALIKRFKPKKIISLHSPLGFYDFDGPSASFEAFEKWLDKISKETDFPLKKFGFFPGSLGNYAGYERNIFTLTLELPSSEPFKGEEFLHKFQPAIIKFINLSTKIFLTQKGK